MRRSLTLMELIFSMVIIAIAFTVFPNVLRMSAKTANYALKEEAMYSALGLMGLIKNLPWDENDTQEDDILHVQRGLYMCGYGFGSSPAIYRIGGFVGSRNCAHHLAASPLGLDDAKESEDPDDIDDFRNTIKVATNSYGKREYNLTVDVKYLEDPALTQKKIALRPSNETTDIKWIEVRATAQKMQRELGSRIASFWYISCNIGQTRINKMAWSGQ